MAVGVNRLSWKKNRISRLAILTEDPWCPLFSAEKTMLVTATSGTLVGAFQTLATIVWYGGIDGARLGRGYSVRGQLTQKVALSVNSITDGVTNKSERSRCLCPCKT